MSPTVRVSMRNAGAQLRADHKKQVAAVHRGLLEAAFLGEQVVVQATPSDTANTRQRWQVIPTSEGADLVNDSPVATYLELGTRPHMAPIMPLVRWVARKRGVSLAGVERLSDVPSEIVAAARGLQQKIAREGGKRFGMISKNLDKLNAIARARVEKQLAALKVRATKKGGEA